MKSVSHGTFGASGPRRPALFVRVFARDFVLILVRDLVCLLLLLVAFILLHFVLVAAISLNQIPSCNFLSLANNFRDREHKVGMVMWTGGAFQLP